MRVMVTTDTVGGVWTFTQELVEGLVQKQIEVVLVSFGRLPSEDQRQWVEQVQQTALALFSFVPTDYKLEWMPDGHDSIEPACDFLRRLLLRHNVGLLHSSQFCFGSVSTDVPKLVTAHSDVVSWWHATHGTAPPASAWMERYRQTVTEGLVKADAVSAPTQWYLTELQVHFPVTTRKCSVVPNGRTAGPILRASSRTGAATAGRIWDEGKNTRILSQVKTKVPIVIAGERTSPGKQGHPPDTWPENVRFAGTLDSEFMHALLSSSAIYIATSRYEPFGLAPLEAALAGCVLLANDIPSFREVWRDAALYYDRDDPASLGGKLDRLAGDPELVNEFAAKARAHAEGLYSADVMVDRYVNLYASLIRERTAAHVA